MNLSSQHVVGLSAGDSHDLDHFGYGPEHIDEVVVRISSMLLEAGFRLGYGGVLRGEGFTESLIEVAKGEIRSRTEYESEPTDEQRASDPIEPLIAYQAWPYYGVATEIMRAELHGYVRFVRVDAEGDELRAPASDADFLNQPDNAWCVAKALSRMRDLMSHGGPDDHRDKAARGARSVPRCVARIALGGRIEDWRGMAPGVAEEIACHLAFDPPDGDDKTRPAIFLIGALGGCVGAIATAMTSKSKTVRKRALGFLEPEFHATLHKGDREKNTPYTLMRKGAAEAKEAAQATERLQWVKERILEVVDDPSRLHNGLTPKENRRLLLTEDVGLMRQLIMRGLRKRRFAEPSRKPRGGETERKKKKEKKKRTTRSGTQ